MQRKPRSPKPEPKPEPEVDQEVEPALEFQVVNNLQSSVGTLHAYGALKQKPSEARPAPTMHMDSLRLFPGLNYVEKRELERFGVSYKSCPGWLVFVDPHQMTPDVVAKVAGRTADWRALKRWRDSSPHEHIRALLDEELALRGKLAA